MFRNPNQSSASRHLNAAPTDDMRRQEEKKWLTPASPHCVWWVFISVTRARATATIQPRKDLVQSGRRLCSCEKHFRSSAKTLQAFLNVGSKCKRNEIWKYLKQTNSCSWKEVGKCVSTRHAFYVTDRPALCQITHICLWELTSVEKKITNTIQACNLKFSVTTLSVSVVQWK